MTQHSWLQHYPKEVPPTFEYPKQHVAQFLINAAAKYPHHPAIHFLGKNINYDELLNASYRFANALKSLGIKREDRVAIMLPNCPQTIIAYFGSLMAGAIVVQTNPLYVHRELEHQMLDSGAKLIVCLDLLIDRVRGVLPTTALEKVIVTSIKDYLPFPKKYLYPLKMKREGLWKDIRYEQPLYSFKQLLKQASPTHCLEAVDAENDVALLQYTGGTTGVSKGVMLTHYNLVANTLQARMWCYKGREGKERYLAVLPFFHVFGMTILMNQSVLLAGTLILIPKFDVDLVLKSIHKQKPTIFPGAPTMYIALLNHPDIHKYNLSTIEVCISGAASLPAEVQDQFERLTGGKLIEGYGQTEASPVTHCNNIWGKRKLGSIGIPFIDTIAKVVDSETGEELPIGKVGEIVVKGPQVMKGYWNHPEKTEETLRGGWLYTGDMALMDDEGFFYIMDRKKDMIIAGGFNIFPREVEEVLFEHPKVQECVVAGLPDKYRGETVKAYIVLKSDTRVSMEELDLWCRTRLASYKVPRIYEFREELPKTMIGKVLRRKLVEEELEEETED
jgi:long-chain acyl-CoA synthetase